MLVRRAVRLAVLVAAVAVALPAVGSAQNRGVQFTPDGKRVLVNKDVGNERWAITLNENGSATGNVFRSDGGPPAFIFCAPGAAANAFQCFGAGACTDSSGAVRNIQSVPDATRVLVQKDVGVDRWAISLNFDDGTATGNIFRSDGGEPAFVVCTPTGAPNEFDCSGADKCQGTPCTAPYTPIARVTLPDTFFAVPDPCPETYGLIGDVTLPDSFFTPVATVTFSVGATAPLQAFQIQVSYPVAKGSFVGSGADVSCTSDGAGVFTKNENDAAGTLVLSNANTSAMTFPVTIRCGFTAVGTVAGTDFTVLVQEVTQNNALGDPSTLSVGVGVP
jgi:hypothetical protein